ncbi:hypothetical protein BGX38DRAFT_1155262 [Terfezia claveryi]|nr:hypothetical protein BGX38DRAFT_1155262 [Terfezia claveryi]
MGAVIGPPPNALLAVAVGAAADLAGPPKIFGVPVVFPKNPVAGVDPALLVGKKPDEAAVDLSAACDAAAPNVGTTDFAASAVGVAGFSPPAEGLLNIPPAGDADLFAPKTLGVEAAAGVVAGFEKALDPPNSVEPPVAPPKAVLATLVNVDVLVVGVEAGLFAPPKSPLVPDAPPNMPPLVLVEGVDVPACVEAGCPGGLPPKRPPVAGADPNSPPLASLDVVPDPNNLDVPPEPPVSAPKNAPPLLLDISVALVIYVCRFGVLVSRK